MVAERDVLEADLAAGEEEGLGSGRVLWARLGVGRREGEGDAP